MKIILSPSSPGRASQKNRLQERFDKLRNQLSKQEKLNKKFQDVLDELVVTYQTELAHTDRRQIVPLTLLASRLLKFYTRKSLSHWHREELGDWIGETITRIGAVEAETADGLHGEFRRVVAAQMGLSEAQLDQRARAYAEARDEVFGCFDDDEGAPGGAFDAEDAQPDLFGFDDIFEETPADERFESDAAAPDEPADNPRGRRLMDAAWVNSLFRRATQALHPDREPDPERRQLKQQLMQRLLEARKQADVMTLPSVYSEHVADGDMALAGQEMASACELMEERLDQLRQEKAAYVYTHPLRSLVHDLLYSPARKTREQKVRQWKQALQAEAQSTSWLVDYLRNLQTLKAILEERREQRILEHMDVEIDWGV